MPASPPTDAQLQHVRDQERRRIGALLHDELGGQLLGLKLAAARIACKLDATPDIDWLREQMQVLEAMAANCLATSAQISTDLALPPWQAGLSAALQNLCQQFGWQSGIRCDYLGPTDQPGMRKLNALSAQQTQALYLICREALNNVGKHAQASHVTIQLTVDETGVDLKISDNGKGIALACRNDLAAASTGGKAHEHSGNNVPERRSNNAAERGSCQGLPGMAARAQEIGASLRQTVAPGQPGCCWEVHLNQLMT